MNLSERIKLKREELGINARKLAELCGSNPTTIGLLESGKNENPTLAILVRLAEVFDVSLDWLVFGREDLFLPSIYNELDDFEKKFLREYLEFCLARKNVKNSN